MSRAVVVATGTLSEEVAGGPRATTDQGLALAVAVVPPVGELEAEAVVVAVGGAGRSSECERKSQERNMKSEFANRNLPRLPWIAAAVAWVCLIASVPSPAQDTAIKKAPAATTVAPSARGFDTPQQAADVLIDAAEKFDVKELAQIFGPGGEDIVFSGEYAQDRQHAANFVAEAHEKKSVSVDPKSGNRAFLLVGDEDWPFPVPLVKSHDKWFFDSKAGRQELLYRRIGSNELDAISVCIGYVEAQEDYALQQRSINDPNQYAQ